jgi:hypothetical protein
MPDQMDFMKALTPKQATYWMMLPSAYRFEEVAPKIVPKATLSRIHGLALSVGVLQKSEGLFRKVAPLVGIET